MLDDEDGERRRQAQQQVEHGAAVGRRRGPPPARRAARSWARAPAPARSRRGGAGRRADRRSRRGASASRPRLSSSAAVPSTISVRARSRPQSCRSSPSRASSASATFSATVSCGKSELIWKVRARPSATRRSGASVGDVGAVEPDRSAARGCSRPGHEIDERRLAGAVRADERVPRAGTQRQRHLARDAERAEALRDALDLERGIRSRAVPARAGARRRTSRSRRRGPAAR